MAALSGPPWRSLLLLGPTGSGKTPLGSEIERRGLEGRRCVHFDFGARLRAICGDPAAAEGLEEAEVSAVRRSLATGALFEDRDLPLIVRIVERFVFGVKLGAEDLIVLNGLPRRVGQAEGLAGLLGVERIVLLEADEPVIRERLRHDPGGDRSGRTDTSPELVRRRLADFRELTRPLLAFYGQRGVPVTAIAVSASMTAAEMYLILVQEVAV